MDPKTKAQTSKARRLMPWVTLVFAGSISLGVNLWHALDTQVLTGDKGHQHWTAAATTASWTVLAVLVAVGPVLVAAFTSHDITSGGAGWFKQTLTYVVFGMAMSLSINAQATAVRPFLGDINCWIFPIMLDLTTFMALHTILTMAPAKAPRKAPARPAGEASPAATVRTPPRAPSVSLAAPSPATVERGRGVTAATLPEGGARGGTQTPPKRAVTASAPPSPTALSDEEIVADVLAKAPSADPLRYPGVDTLRARYTIGDKRAARVRDRLKALHESHGWPPPATLSLHAVPTPASPANPSPVTLRKTADGPTGTP